MSRTRSFGFKRRRSCVALFKALRFRQYGTASGDYVPVMKTQISSSSDGSPGKLGEPSTSSTQLKMKEKNEEGMMGEEGWAAFLVQVSKKQLSRCVGVFVF